MPCINLDTQEIMSSSDNSVSIIPIFDIKKFVMPSREEINKRYTFESKYWIDFGNYWLNTAPQGSEQWHLHRKFRLTAFNFGGAIGKSHFCTPMDIALDLTNIKTKSLSEYSKATMQHSIITEPKARDWYCRTRNVEVIEVGLAVPKWEPRIGVSLDGDVKNTDGIIEIKSPLEIYEPLRNHMAKIRTGWRPPPFYHSHIWESHYAQMQGGMKITNKRWCDYIVYATESNLSYVERIPFNQVYWETLLWPGILNFLDNIMEPLIAQGQQSHLFQMDKGTAVISC
jgi:putative phage-type endonuclease